MNVRYRVELTQYERNELGALLTGGKRPVGVLKRAKTCHHTNSSFGRFGMS